jgi:PPOX class probable FMN-dependent enzyme
MSDKIETLREEHGMPSDRAQVKVLPYLNDEVKSFIQLAPFAVLSTSNDKGDCDASPRGGKPGFIKVINDNTLIIPDIRGNRLFQSLENIFTNPKAGLLFIIPGNNRTVRVNGSVKLLELEELAELKLNNEVFNIDDTSHVIQAIELTVKEAYSHCPRAFTFSDLWNKDNY